MLDAELSARRIRYQGQPAVLGVFRDVTMRVRAEVALRESEERFRSLFETSRDGVVMVDLDGRILRANPAYQAMLGFRLDELYSMTYQDLTPPCWHEVEAAIVRERVLLHGDSGEYDKEYIRKDGSVFPVSLRAWPLYDEGGRAVAMRAFVRDISDRKRIEGALREADRRKDEFLATLAHELRNPLAPIRSGLQVLRKTGGQGPAAEQVQSIMERQVEHLVRLVDDLLEVSRISLGKIELKKEAVDLADIVNQAIGNESDNSSNPAAQCFMSRCRRSNCSFMPIPCGSSRLSPICSTTLPNTRTRAGASR